MFLKYTKAYSFYIVVPKRLNLVGVSLYAEHPVMEYSLQRGILENCFLWAQSKARFIFLDLFIPET